MNVNRLIAAIESDMLPPNLLPFKPIQVGDEGQWYVGYECGCDWPRDDDVLVKDLIIPNYIAPPHACPSLWCDWTLDDDNMTLRPLDGKHYGRFKWPNYLIESFFKPWGYVLNGKVKFKGEDPEDIGLIYIKDNVVTSTYAWTKVR